MELKWILQLAGRVPTGRGVNLAYVIRIDRRRPPLRSAATDLRATYEIGGSAIHCPVICRICSTR
jgi:hypothetical protein